MKNEEIIEINKKGWDDLIKSNKKFANTSLPDYGPFLKRNEEEINLFNSLQNKSILWWLIYRYTCVQRNTNAS